MGSHESHIAGDPAIEQIEVFTHGPPAHVRGGSAVDRGEVVQELLQLIGRRRGIGQSVHAEEFGGDALAELRLMPGFRQKDEVRMGVHIYEAGADDALVHIYGLSCFNTVAAGTDYGDGVP